MLILIFGVEIQSLLNLLLTSLYEITIFSK